MQGEWRMANGQNHIGVQYLYLLLWFVNDLPGRVVYDGSFALRKKCGENNDVAIQMLFFAVVVVLLLCFALLLHNNVEKEGVLYSLARKAYFVETA